MDYEKIFSQIHYYYEKYDINQEIDEQMRVKV